MSVAHVFAAERSLELWSLLKSCIALNSKKVKYVAYFVCVSTVFNMHICMYIVCSGLYVCILCAVVCMHVYCVQWFVCMYIVCSGLYVCILCAVACMYEGVSKSSQAGPTD